MLLLSNTSDAQGDFGLDLVVSQPEGGVILNCTCIPLSFTLSNIDDNPNTVTLDLQTLIGRYEFCDNPGFVLMPAPGANQQIGTVDVWRMTGITLAPYQLRTITASIRVISFIADLDPSIASTATNGVVTEGPTNAFTVGFDHSFVTIGVDQNSVTSLHAIANGTSGNLLPPPAGPGQDILLNGELVVDVNETYTFGGGSHLNLGPNAKISVLDGNALQLISTTKIRSCGQTWNTIEIMNGGTLVIDRAQGNQSCTPCELEIRDGEVAVTARNGSTVQINGAKFRNNGVGVRVPNDAAGNNISLNVTNNLFEENGPSLLPGFAGLDLNDLYVAVVGRNTYKNMNYGIYGTNSSLFTLYDEFSDLGYAGIAMIGNGHFLYQVGKGNSLATPTFSNVSTGVRTVGMSVYITENGITGVTSGVRAYMLNNKNVFVFDNTIAARNNGILVSSLRPLTYSTIGNNTITMDGNPDGRGINSISTNIGAAPYVRINGNIINLLNATYGVDMVSNRGVEAKGNNVTLGNPQTGFGMAVSGGGTNHLLGNFLNAASLVNEQYGISVGQSLQGEYGCNHFSGTRTGLWFTGPNASSDIAGNDFNGFFFGLQVGNGGAPGSPNLGGYTGRQSHRGNMWNSAPAATGFGAIHYSQIPFEVTDSQHEVDVANGSNLITTEKTFVQGVNYFVPVSGDTYTCPSNLVGSDPSGQLGSLEQGIASGSATIGTFTAENWTAERQLYRQLKANPALAPQGSVYASFLDTEANTTVGRFEDLQTGIDTMLAGDASLRTQLSGYISSMETRFGEVRTIEDGLIAQPGDTALLAQRSAKQVEIVTLASQSQAVEQSMLAARVSSATQLLATNAAISTNSTHEANQKTANRILIETVANNQTELTAQQVADLTPIASQCPYAGGEGVYAARALLGNEVVYNDFVACGMGSGGQQIKAIENGIKSGITFTVYPNPMNGLAVLELENGLESDGRLVVTSILGQAIYSEVMSKGTQAIPLDLTNHPAGTYFVAVITANGNTSRTVVNTKQ